VGDSIADGVGADPTGDGSDGLRYGGAALPAGVRLWDQGVEVFTWPDNAGAGPDPGYLPHLALAALAAGFAAVHIVRYSTPGITTSTTRSSEWTQALQWMAANNFVPDLVLIAAGTNDSQAGENSAFEASSSALARDCEGFPNARIGWLEPVALAAGSYPEADLVRADIQALQVGRTRFRVAGAGVGRADDAHPSLQGYKDQGAAIWPAYQAAG